MKRFRGNQVMIEKIVACADQAGDAAVRHTRTKFRNTIVHGLERRAAAQDKRSRRAAQRLAQQQHGNTLLIFVGLIALLAVLVVIGIRQAIDDAHAWQRFKADHDCRVVERIPPSTSVGVTFGSKDTSPTIVTTPGRVGWLCDDEVTHWINE